MYVFHQKCSGQRRQAELLRQHRQELLYSLPNNHININMAEAEATLTKDEILFTNAFNNQRMTLAGFAKCNSEEELHIVRDGFFLGLASDLRIFEYNYDVRETIVTDADVAGACKTENAFRKTVEAARKSKEWSNMLKSLKATALSVGSDLDEIWMTLEKGRLEWLGAASSAHKIKELLKNALNNQCGGGAMDGDVSDAKMIWMYSLSLSIPDLDKEAEAWRRAVDMKDKNRPLVGYKPELWDCRKEEWAPLDVGVQKVAERGGSSIEEAWNL